MATNGDWKEQHLVDEGDETPARSRSPWETIRRYITRYVTLTDHALIQECKFRVHARRQSRNRLLPLILGFGSLVFLIWPTDFFFFESSKVIRFFTGWRIGTFLAMGLLVGLVNGMNLVKERNYWFLTVYLTLYFAATGYLFGEIRGLSFPWFYIAYVIPMFTVPVAVDLLPRFVGSTVVTLSYVGAYMYNVPGAGLYPDIHQFVPLTASAIFLFTMIGHSLYYLDRINFFQSQVVKAQRQRLKELARRDQLTGLLNRRELESRYQEEFNRADRYDHNLAVMMADLDHFKEVNDTHGHRSGDRVLEETGDLLDSMTRRVDIPGRYGGEEFVVVLPGTDLQDARDAAERVRKELARRTFNGDDGDAFNVSCSIGLAEMEQDDRGPESLLKRADRALYHAKEEGRDRVATA